MNALARLSSVDRAELLAISRAGLASPSGDNTQPWRIVLHADGFDLRFCPVRGEALLDSLSLASRISAGAFLENVHLAARARGFEVRCELSPDAADPLLWARVELYPCSSIEDPLVAAIDLRHTCRDLYDGSPLDPDLRTALLGQAAAPIEIAIISGRKPLDRLATYVAVGERIRAQTRRAHDDLQRWIRWTPAEAEASRDGLDVRTLGLRGPERGFLRWIRPWWRARIANLLGAARLVGAHASRQVRSSSAAGVIVAPLATAENAVAVGRVLQRVWLRATLSGAVFAPIMSLPLLDLRCRLQDGTGLAPHHAARLRAIAPAWRALFSLSPEQQPLFLFRIGRARTHSIRALRRPIEEVAE